MLSHGTLLLDSNLDDVTAALRPKPGKVESKGVKSVRSRVANISEFVSAPIDVSELRERIIERIFGTRDRATLPLLALDETDWNAARELMDRKYGTMAWNYGENPRSNVQRSQRFAGGEIDVRVDVQEGRISGLRLFGDFMGRHDVDTLEGMLKGVLYERTAILDALGDLDLGEFFTGITRDEVLGVLLP
jgi:lipoate-protein ligase A